MLLNWCQEITNLDPSINFRYAGGWLKTVTGLDKSVLNGYSLVGEFVKSGDFKEIYYEIYRRNPNIGQATVYRMLLTLEDIGAIRRVQGYVVNECDEKTVV